LISEFLDNFSWHSPLFESSFSAYAIAGIATAAGLILGILCRLSYGAFFVWGALVGFLLVAFGWVCGYLLPVKWALVLFTSIVLPLVVLWYVQEASPAYGHELRTAARVRGIKELQELFDNDPNAAESIAESLNRDVDPGSDDWPEGSVFRGIPPSVVKRAILSLAIGYVLIAILAIAVALNP